MAKEKKVVARILFEIAGSPKEYVEETMDKLVDEIKLIKNFKVIRDEVFETEQKGKLWSTFGELEIEFKDELDMLNFVVDFAPTSVEVLEPEMILLPLSKINAFLNDLMAKFHARTMQIKNLEAENIYLKRNFKTTIKNYITTLLRFKELSLSEIEKLTGINEEELKIYLNELLAEGFVEKDNELYYFKKIKS